MGKILVNTKTFPLKSCRQLPTENENKEHSPWQNKGIDLVIVYDVNFPLLIL